MSDIWVTSDQHFHHENILLFTDSTGARIRPGFSSVDEMNEYMVSCWNEKVKPQDKVYQLGDFVVRGKSLNITKRLQGKKRIILGNHDKFHVREYIAAGFEKILGVRNLHGLWLSHIPLHPGSLGRGLGNVHGHIHQNPSPEGRYFNACVEPLRYKPVHLEELLAYFRSQEVVY